MPGASPTLKGFAFGVFFSLVLLMAILGISYPYLQALTVVLAGVIAGSYGYALSQSRNLYRIKISREFSAERGVEGSEIEVFIKVKNLASVPLYRVEVEDYPPWRSRALSETYFTFSIGPGEEKVFSYRIRPAFGRHRWSVLRVAVGDPFGLFRAERESA